MPLEPDYLGRWLPGQPAHRPRRRATFPVLSAAAVAGLPAERFGVGGAINQTARQIGAVLGVALLVVDPRHADVAEPPRSTPSSRPGSSAPPVRLTAALIASRLRPLEAAVARAGRRRRSRR